jgi:hypothetical protein
MKVSVSETEIAERKRERERERVGQRRCAVETVKVRRRHVQSPHPCT